MHLCTDVCTQCSCRRCQKIRDALELELQSAVSCPAPGLGRTRGLHTHNPQAIFPAQFMFHLCLFFSGGPWGGEKGAGIPTEELPALLTQFLIASSGCDRHSVSYILENPNGTWEKSIGICKKKSLC